MAEVIRISCEQCKINMQVINQNRRSTLKLADKDYYCPSCHMSVSVILEETDLENRITELELEVREIEMDTDIFIERCPDCTWYFKDGHSLQLAFRCNKCKDTENGVPNTE